MSIDEVWGVVMMLMGFLLGGEVVSIFLGLVIVEYFGDDFCIEFILWFEELYGIVYFFLMEFGD